MKKLKYNKEEKEYIKLFFRPKVIVLSIIIAAFISILDVFYEAIFIKEDTFINILIHNYTAPHHLTENIIILTIIPLFFITIVFIITRNKQFKISLLSLQEKYYHLLDNADLGIYRLSLPDFKFEFVNKAIRVITGYSSLEFYKNPDLIKEIVYPDDSEYFKRELNALINKQNTNSIIFRIISYDGKIKWLYQKNLLILDNNLSPIAIESVISDITDLQETKIQLQQKNEEIKMQNEKLTAANEEIKAQLEDIEKINDELTNTYIELRKQNEKYKQTYKYLPMPTYSWLLDGIDFKLIDFNLAGEKFTNGQVANLLGIQASIFFKDNLEVLDDMMSIIKNKNISEREISYTFKLLPDTKKIMKYYYSYIPDDIVLIHIEDITEKKDYENKLKLSEKRYRTLAENLPCLIFRVLWQENRKLVFFNNMLEHITGYKTLPATKGEIFSLDTLILKEDIKKTITDIKSAILKNKSFNIECRLIHKDEHIIYCQMLGQPIYDDNNNLIFIDGFLIDITQKKIYENELKIKNNEIEAQNEELKVAHEELSIAYSTINQRQRELEEINKQLQNINNQLKESEQLKHLAYEELNNIFQAVNLPMFIIDIEYNITKINQQGKEFFKSINCDIDSSIGNKCYHVLHKMKSLPYFCLAKDMISKNSNLPISKEINIGNKCFLLNCSAILDHNGNVKEIIHVLTKIDKT